MATTTTKELRENLASIRKRVMAGESIDVIYRSRPVMRITPIKNTKPANRDAALKAIDEYIAYVKKNQITFSADPNKSAKELYHEILDEKYGR